MSQHSEGLIKLYKMFYSFLYFHLTICEIYSNEGGIVIMKKCMIFFLVYIIKKHPISIQYLINEY